MGQAGEVDDGVRRGLADHPLEAGGVLQVHLEKPHLSGLRKGGVIDVIGAAHPVARGQQMAREAGSDETADAGDQDVHAEKPAVRARGGP